MKNISIVTRKMIVGGIEKALISMLKDVDYNRYNVDLYIEEEGGILEKDIPKNVNIKYIFKEEASVKKKILQSFKERQYYKAITLIKNGLNIILSSNKYRIYKNTINTLPKIEKKYDIAIAYHNPISFSTIYVIDKIIANKKVLWVHSNIDEYKNIVDDFKRYYYLYDKIFFVSKDIKEVFCNRYSSLKSKSEVYYNRIYRQEIIDKSNEKCWNYRFEGIKILTVSRISYEKGIDMIPMIVNEMKKENYSFKWYLIGDGKERNNINNLIKKYNIEDKLILLGEKENPYIAMKRCDIYVQPSRFEAFGITIAEAKCLNKPIVACDIAGLREQIINNVNGTLTHDNYLDIYKGIKELIDNREIREKYSSNLKNEVIDTRIEIKKLYNLV